MPKSPNHKKKRIAFYIKQPLHSLELLQRVSKQAQEQHASWYVIHIETGKQGQDVLTRQHVESLFSQARQMGGKVIDIQASSAAEGIIHAMELHEISHLYLGHVNKAGFWPFKKNPLAVQLASHSDHFSVTELSLSAHPTGGMVPFKKGHAITAHLLSIGLIALLTLVVEVVQESLPEYRFNASIYNVSMLYLLAIVFCALRFGLSAAIGAAIFSFILYNYFFISPFYHFGLERVSDVLNFALFLSASFISVLIAKRYQLHMQDLKEKELAARALYELNRSEQTEDPRDIAVHISMTLQKIVGRSVMLFLQNGTLNMVYPKKRHDRKKRINDAMTVYQKQEEAYLQGWYFYPISTTRSTLGVLAIRAVEEEPLTPRLLRALSYQAGLAMERYQLMAEARTIKIQHEREAIRSTILSSISHDLKTPLVSVIGALSSIRHMDRSLSVKEQRVLLDTALAEANRLNQSITNILDITKFESGDIKPRKQWIDTYSLFTDAVHHLTTELKDHRIVVERPDRLFSVHVDPVLFGQLLWNILTNAAKYTPKNSTITLSAKVHRNKAILTITDSGPGIDEALHKEAFNSFTRFAKKDSISGTGLGLAISKAIVAIHGGTISLGSAKEDGGLVVIITLNQKKYMDARDGQKTS